LSKEKKKTKKKKKKKKNWWENSQSHVSSISTLTLQACEWRNIRRTQSSVASTETPDPDPSFP
jgi:endonuclease III-like uncharacterized protein